MITIFDTLTFMFIHYFGVRKLEAFFATLIGIMAVAFSINFFFSDPDWLEIAEGTLIPSLSI